MKRKTLRILIIALCVVVITAEAVLLTMIFKKKSTKQTKKNNTLESVGRLYAVKRLVRWTKTEPETTATYTFDEYGRIKEIVTDGHFRETLPDSASNYGIRRERYYYDESGQLVKISSKVNDEKWVDEEVIIPIKKLTTDSHGGVYYNDLFLWKFGFQYVLSDSGTIVIDIDKENPEQYDKDGRLIEKDYNAGSGSGRRSYFTYEENAVIRKDYYENDVLIRICRFEYDYKGRLIKAIATKDGYNTDIITYEYDEDDNLVREDHRGKNTSFQEQYIYDEDGFLYRIKEFGTSIVEENREYEMFLVGEDYLTDEERMRLGLPYDEDMIKEKGPQLDIKSWRLTDDELVLY